MTQAQRLALAICLCASIQAFGETDDVRRFMRYPAYDIVALSPAGTYVAVAHRRDGAEYLSVLRLPGLEPVSSTRFSEHLGIDRIIWATEDRLLLQPAQRQPTRDDYKLPTGEIAAMDVDGSHRETLYGFRAGVGQMGVKARRRESEATWARVIDRLRDDPDHVLIQSMGYGRAGIRNEALLLDIHDGVTRSIARSPLRNGDFIADLGGHVGLVAGRNEAGDLEVYLREPDRAFRLVRRTRLNGGVFYPLLPTARPGEYLFADSASRPTLGIMSWAPASDERREIFRHPEVDYERVFVAPYPRVWAIRYIDHFPDYYYPDPAHPLVPLHQALRSTYANDDVAIIDQTEDLRLALAEVSGPAQPGTFLLLDSERRSVIQQLVARPWLDKVRLATVEPIDVKVRDGLHIRSYLTLPPAEKGPHPLIVLVHGGPHGVYDRWGFDPEAQLFAHRGYAVLQVNFRGSGGRGRDFLEAGYGAWGTRMQDDITDTVRYVTAEGLADAKRICIYGASYGAYSALVGAYRDPELYRCAVGYAGVYDLPLLFERGDVPQVEAGVNFLESVLGTDPEELRDRSPVYHADRIRAAVMLVHGKLDERAPFAHARRMREALVAAGNEPRWLVENREGHGFLDENNRFAFYQTLLDFFDEHLRDGGGITPP